MMCVKCSAAETSRRGKSNERDGLRSVSLSCLSGTKVTHYEDQFNTLRAGVILILYKGVCVGLFAFGIIPNVDVSVLYERVFSVALL